MTHKFSSKTRNTRKTKKQRGGVCPCQLNASMRGGSRSMRGGSRSMRGGGCGCSGNTSKVNPLTALYGGFKKLFNSKRTKRNV